MNILSCRFYKVFFLVLVLNALQLTKSDSESDGDKDVPNSSKAYLEIKSPDNETVYYVQQDPRLLLEWAFQNIVSSFFNSLIKVVSKEKKANTSASKTELKHSSNSTSGSGSNSSSSSSSAFKPSNGSTSAYEESKVCECNLLLNFKKAVEFISSLLNQVISCQKQDTSSRPEKNGSSSSASGSASASTPSEEFHESMKDKYVHEQAYRKFTVDQCELHVFYKKALEFISWLLNQVIRYQQQDASSRPGKNGSTSSASGSASESEPPQEFAEKFVEKVRNLHYQAYETSTVDQRELLAIYKKAMEFISWLLNQVIRYQQQDASSRPEKNGSTSSASGSASESEPPQEFAEKFVEKVRNLHYQAYETSTVDQRELLAIYKKAMEFISWLLNQVIRYQQQDASSRPEENDSTSSASGSSSASSSEAASFAKTLLKLSNSLRASFRSINRNAP